MYTTVESWNGGLEPRLYRRMDIALDGVVWLRATERMPDGSARSERGSFDWLPNEPVHTYVTTPEAVAATE